MNTKAREQSREVVLALLRNRDARALLAAALIVVTLTLTVHNKARALDETRRTVLYVGAPSVSVSTAREASKISRSYAEVASLETLLALGFSGESASRYTVERALASVTEQPADPDETITAQAALEASAIYLAQTGTRPPGGELAIAGPVRPELGDGTVAPAEGPPADDTSTKDVAGVGRDGNDGDLAYAGGPLDKPVAAYPGTSENDPAALYPISGGEEPMELISSSPTGTGAREDFREEPPEFDTGPISTKEQVPTTLAGGQMEIPSSQSGQATEPADGGEELAALPVESPPEEDAANTLIEATNPHPFPGQEPSTTPSVEEPDDVQSPAILLAEPAADEEASDEASTPDGGEGAPGETTVANPQEHAEEGFEDDASGQVIAIVAGGEPDQSQDVTAAYGELSDETPRRSPEPGWDREAPRPDAAEPTGTTEAPPEPKPEQETPPAEDTPYESAPGEVRPPDRQDDRASTERPASGPAANDPRGKPRDGAVISPPGGRLDDPGQVPAVPEDREPAHGETSANGRALRDDADRHSRRPVDAPETISREPRVLSDRGTRRPEEMPAEDGARRTAREQEPAREDAVEPVRLKRARQERLAARRAARETTAAFGPTRTKSEDRGHGRREPLAADGCGQGSTNDGASDVLDASYREENLD